MKIVFRVDASSAMGSGHLIRCKNLALALIKRGAEVSFICRDFNGNLIHDLLAESISVSVLASPKISARTTDSYLHWLGVSQEVDAAETILALNSEHPDWMIVDHYALDIVWEKQVKPHVKKVLVIDDLANRLHLCDLLLDQNYSFETNNRYQRLLPEDSRQILGPRYALMDSNFQHAREKMSKNRIGIKTILIYLGGVDPDNITSMALLALSDPKLEEIQVNVLIGANSPPHRQAVEVLVEARPYTKLYEPQDNMVELLVGADLVIGAGGVSALERLSLGVPTILVSVADNQIAVCKALAAAGCAYYVGHAPALLYKELLGQLLWCIENQYQITEKAKQGLTIVDALGARRTTEVILPSSENELSLRETKLEDVYLYFSWVNETEVRRQSINTDIIGWQKHNDWFYGKMKASNCHMFVLTIGDFPVGQVRFDVENGKVEIDYSLDKVVRGRGWAANMIIKAAYKMEPHLILIGEVKSSNIASRKVFQGMGFAESLDPYLGVYNYSSSISRLIQDDCETGVDSVN